jgi:catechol 2,3-dioxygenase-like lactoylglutathione lyase family enzyme
MSDNGPRWSLRSALISVSDLDQSTEFYTDVMNLREVLSKDRVAVLGSDATGSFTLFLREANRYAVVSGQQALGLRTLSCDVGSFA